MFCMRDFTTSAGHERATATVADTSDDTNCSGTPVKGVLEAMVSFALGDGDVREARAVGWSHSS